MQLKDFDYQLPETLIARYPLDNRTDSRLMHLNKQQGKISHGRFNQVVDLLKPGDLLILNNSKVIPARLAATKSTGAQLEVFIERIQSSHQALAMIRANRGPKIGSSIFLNQKIEIQVLQRQDQFYVLKFLTNDPILTILEQYGRVPIPPYLNRQADESDNQRYQTVYANPPGSVAAPTAGLHFDNDLLSKLATQGIQHQFVTCHVGAGTFQPVKVTNIHEHQMHAEIVQVSETVCTAIEQTKKNAGRVIAVGTTSVRSLETAARSGKLLPYDGETDIFIYPGFKFQVIDGLITNFHLPRSSLIMLVAAFAGYELTMQAYQTAVDEKYRFYSYGDAMLIAD